MARIFISTAVGLKQKYWHPIILLSVVILTFSISIDRREFKAILFYWHDSAYIFKHINYINDKDLFEVIVNDNAKYSLYKVTRTKLVKGHYGGSFFSSANDRTADVYMNHREYYIFFPNREYRTIHLLKRSAIERLFKLNPDSDIVNEYLQMSGNKQLYTENELKQLILYLNGQELYSGR
jgi:hypothetical protein